MTCNISLQRAWNTSNSNRNKHMKEKINKITINQHEDFTMSILHWSNIDTMIWVKRHAIDQKYKYPRPNGHVEKIRHQVHMQTS